MTLSETALLEEIQAINKKQAWIVLTSALALMVVAIFVFRGSAPAAVVVTIILLVSVKKAILTYLALSTRKQALLAEAA